MIAASCNSPDEAAAKLVSEAHARWVQEEDGIVDDITVVVVAFSHKS
jgi:serine/threonine protein phosphatase PrpC